MRVFNISLHRMGTRSMWCALDVLGFQSSHHPDGMCELYAANQIEQSWVAKIDDCAVSDIPIPCMYRKLYKLFPEARFVIVTRPFDQWFTSLRKHLGHHAMPENAVIEYTMLYGYPITKDDCDEDLCRKVFDRHHADVLEFFREKGKLLTMELASLSWEPLCDFLDLPVPDRAFPRVIGS